MIDHGIKRVLFVCLEHVHVLDIPDEYRFCAPELINKIKERSALWVVSNG